MTDFLFSRYEYVFWVYVFWFGCVTVGWWLSRIRPPRKRK